MVPSTTERSITMYLIKYYNREGHMSNAQLCHNMTIVGRELAAYCNSTVKGNLPTVQNLETGKLVRYADIGWRLPSIRDVVNCMSYTDPNGEYDVESILCEPTVYLSILRRWTEESGWHADWDNCIAMLELLIGE